MRLPTILFVDDEANVLDGLRNLLRRHRRVWNTAFAQSGATALDELERTPVDVIVSDMRMPGMDGAALLTRVKADHPTVARIMLTGQAEREAVMRALPVAHQFLSKPCDAEALRVVLERTCALQAILNDEALRTMVGSFDKLPSTPASYLALKDAAQSATTGCLDIARIVERDPAMSVKVLQLVNSAYFGLGRRIASIPEAVQYLGVELLQGLALSASVFAMLDGIRVDGFDLDQLQRQSLLAARIARRIAGHRVGGDEAFTAALLHDIGKIVMAMGMPARFAEAARAARASGRPLHAVEREMFGVTHADIGAYLLGIWGLPFAIVEAVAYHHRPGAVVTGSRDLLGAVHVAAAVAEIAAMAPGDPAAAELLDVRFAESLGCAQDVPLWLAMERAELDAATEAGSW